MRLNEYIKYIHASTVKITNFMNEKKTIYFGSAKGIKKNLDVFKNYDVVGVFGSDDNNCDLEIYVLEEK